MKITGNVTIRVDGEELLTDGKGTFNPGGKQRDPKVGAKKVNGYTEAVVAPELSVTIHHTKETDLVRLSAITDATAIIETDTGQRWMLRKAFTKEPAVLSPDGGTVSLTMSGMSVERI